MQNLSIASSLHALVIILCQADLKVSASRRVKLRIKCQTHSFYPLPKIKEKNARHLNSKLKIYRQNNEISILGVWKHCNNLIKQFLSISM